MKCSMHMVLYQHDRGETPIYTTPETKTRTKIHPLPFKELVIEVLKENKDTNIRMSVTPCLQVDGDNPTTRDSQKQEEVPLCDKGLCLKTLSASTSPSYMMSVKDSTRTTRIPQ